MNKTDLLLLTTITPPAPMKNKQSVTHTTNHLVREDSFIMG